MTSTLTSNPVGQRGTVANRRGTVVGSTEILSDTLLVVRLDTDQGGYLSGPGPGGSQRILPQPNSSFSAYISTMLVAPDCWVPEEQA